MTDQEIRQLIESGVERSEIEYVMRLDYIGETFQRQLLQLLADGNMDAYEGALTQLWGCSSSIETMSNVISSFSCDFSSTW